MILLRPVGKQYTITQLYGENPDKYPKPWGHPGIDWGLPLGTQIQAVADGLVVEAINQANVDYGVHVRLKHDFGYTIYGHGIEDGLLVCKGDTVRMGQPIMLSGNTGWSTGPHLHLGLYPGTGIVPEDPMPYMVDERPNSEALCLAEVTASDGLKLRSMPKLDAGWMRVCQPKEVLRVYDVTYNGYLMVDGGYVRIGDANEKWVRLLKILDGECAIPSAKP